MDNPTLGASPPPADASAAAYFDAVLDAFQRAEQATGSVQYFYRLDGRIVCQRFAGSALVPQLSPALAHLRADADGPAALTVCLCDSASTGVGLPRPPWPSHAYNLRGEIEGYNDGRYFAALEGGAQALNLFDRERGLAIFWAASAAALPSWEAGAPIRLLLHWWLSGGPLQLVHGGAVGLPDGGVLLVGRGGSGKSTSVLACLDSDLSYAGDDYVAARVEPSPFIYSLYSTGKVDGHSLGLLPGLAAAAANPDGPPADKTVLFLHRARPEKIAAGFPLRAILLPRISGRSETRLVSAAPSQALSAVAPSTLIQMHGEYHQAFQKMVSLVRRTPAFWLEVGADLTQIPRTILDLLARPP